MGNFAKVASQFKFVNSSIFKQLFSVLRENNFVVQEEKKKTTKTNHSLLEVEIQQKENGCS